MAPEPAHLPELLVKVVTGAITVGVVFLGYRGHFIGTWDEIGSVFGVAFMSDLTFESVIALVLQVATGKAAKPAGAGAEG
jgi:hypothetical protein